MSAYVCGCDPEEQNHHCEIYPNCVWGRIDRPHTWVELLVGNNPPLPRASNPKFDAVITRMVETHNRKSSDYAKDTNRYSNFEETAATAGCSVDTVFLVMIGVKLARLRELLSSGKTAQNESVQDSRLDLAVYAALWASYHSEGV